MDEERTQPLSHIVAAILTMPAIIMMVVSLAWLITSCAATNESAVDSALDVLLSDAIVAIACEQSCDQSDDFDKCVRICGATSSAARTVADELGGTDGTEE